LVIMGAISVNTGAGLATSLLREFGPLPVVALRIVFGAVMVLLMGRPHVRGVPRSALVSCVAMGLILVAMNTSFYLALSRLPLGVAVTIEFWGPLTVAILGSRRPLDLLWVALAAGGIWVLTGGRLNADDALGVAAVFCAGGFWALYIVVGGRFARDWPDGRGLGLAMIVASAVVLPVAASLSDFRPLLASPAAIGGGLVVALLGSTIPYTLEVAALRRMRAATFGVLLSLEPAIAAILGFVILGQVLHTLDLAAIACVAVASAGASITARRLRVTAGEMESA
jgi:inner membrane transporter RhtA